MSDADLIIMAIGIDAVLKDLDEEFIVFRFERALNPCIPRIRLVNNGTVF